MNELQKLWARMSSRDFTEYMIEIAETTMQEVLFEDSDLLAIGDMKVGGVYLIFSSSMSTETAKVWKKCNFGDWTPELDNNWVEVYELEPGLKPAEDYCVGDVVMRGDDNWVLYKADAESWNVYKRIRVESNKSMNKIFETGRIENELF